MSILFYISLQNQVDRQTQPPKNVLYRVGSHNTSKTLHCIIALFWCIIFITMSRQFLLIFIISLALVTPVSSKDIVLEAAETGLQVRQQPHTEEFLQSFFNQLPQSVDTLYATIFRPAHCPRCEATITKTHTLLKEHAPHPTVLISVYPDSAIAKNTTPHIPFKPIIIYMTPTSGLLISYPLTVATSTFHIC